MKTGLREKIIETSLVLFEKKGFHGVSINEIVTAANTSKGGFYHHFSSKDELLFVIHDLFITYAIEEAEKADKSHESPKKRLEAIIRAFVHVFHVYKAHLSVFYQEAIYLHPKYELVIKQKRNQFKNIILQVIKDGKEKGEFREDIQVDITVMAILGMVNWIHKWYDEQGDKTIDEIADVFTDFVLHAILKMNLLEEGNYSSVLI